jgi:Rieske Fe-S protein
MAHQEADDRRRFLGRLGGVAALGLVAGCGKQETAETADMAPPMPEAGGEPPQADVAPGPVDTGAAPAGSGPLDLGPEAELGDGQGKSAEVAGKPVVVINAGGELKAFSAVCTHKACTVIWNADSKAFECPCHKSAFDVDGKPTGGPAKEPLSAVPVKVEGGQIMVG